jgi:hypothetical protein
MNTPHGFCFTVSKTEKQFVTDNFERIEQRRELENRKDQLRQYQKDVDVMSEVKVMIPEPVPNENHAYC